jgi:GNAT superfamily N-acetyltransferase
MLNIHIDQLDISKMSEEQWRDLLNARAEFAMELRPDDPAPSFQEQRQFLSRVPEMRDQVAFWLIYDAAANVVGYCTLAHPKPDSPDYDANKDRIYVEPVVLAPYRRQGVGTQLLPLILNYAQNVGVSWIQWDTQFEGGFRFSEKLGATVAGQQRTNRLEVDRVNWDLIQRWVDEGRSKNPDVELVRIVNLPEPGLLYPLCDLTTDINRLQPRDDLEGIGFTLTPDELIKQAERQKEQNLERLIVCTREPDGALSGMTDMFHNEARPTHASVRLTGVRREFQNCGRGKWLKGAMMLEMRERYPEVQFIDTDNFNTNAPMLSINERMGFKLFEQFVFYKMRVTDLAARIGLSAVC